MKSMMRSLFLDVVCRGVTGRGNTNGRRSSESRAPKKTANTTDQYMLALIHLSGNVSDSTWELLFLAQRQRADGGASVFPVIAQSIRWTARLPKIGHSKNTWPKEGLEDFSTQVD